MTEHHLIVARSARYYQLNELTPATRRVWFVLHGYGQLAAYFLRHFAPLAAADPALVVLAPEGLSRFYLSGNGGRVGASWMTREDRLSEIDDQVAYLNQLGAPVLSAAPRAAITVLGFSQGAATASRWLSRAAFRPTRLVLWAGAFPDDMDFTVATSLLRGLPVTLVVGEQDEYVGAEQVRVQQAFLRKLGVEPEVIQFAGKHTLDAGVLQQLAAR
ncbi:alpha/beta hydrolase [uncultured Hymenobacter sp.]|uniref:alpha/beta hydrolase n=1 Tax=uncultured Hymenobacter sp. TaxID=170016 RepID=UPI0035C9A460